MECSEKPVWTERTKEELFSLKLEAPKEGVFRKVLENWDSVAKPLDGLGVFETLTAKIGAILGTEQIDIAKKAVLIFCADNGVVEEGVSQSGQEVTLAVAKKMGQQASSVGKMARIVGADTIPVDIGISCADFVEGVLDRKVRFGTRNFAKEPAMTEAEALQAVFTGIGLVGQCKKHGYRMAATGEMGIGNTTTSSALAAALLQEEPDRLTGRGAGLNDEGLSAKRRVIKEALKRYGLLAQRGDGTEDAEDARAFALRALCCVGGLDIAGLAGVCIGGALYHVPVVLDGVISMTAALCAERMVPGTKDYLIGSHMGKEPAIRQLADELGVTTVIDGRMALGEGTGAVMMFGLLDTALSLYTEKMTFEDISIGRYERFEKEPV